MNKKLIANTIGFVLLVAALVYVGLRFAPFIEDQYKIANCQKAGGTWDFTTNGCTGAKLTP